VILLDYKTELRYQKFLSRLEFTSVTKYSHFRDCLHIGMAFSYEKKGDPRFENGYVNPAIVKQLGFNDEEIDKLFSKPNVTRIRKLTWRRNSQIYRQRHGAISYSDRRRQNIEDFRNIIKLRKKKLTRSEIAKNLGLTLNRVRYLLQEYNH